MNVPSLYFRLPDPPGVALDYSKTDFNLRAILDFLSALNGLEFAVLNADGSLKDGTVSSTAKFADRVVTAGKLDWWANLFCIASGTYNYSATINPTLNYTGPGGGVTETTFLLVKFESSNTGASTFSLNGGTAYPIVSPKAVALTSGDIHAGRIHPLVFNGTSWVLMSDRVASLAPTSSQFIVGLLANQVAPWVPATPVRVAWDVVDYDPDATFNVATHQFKAPSAGRYQFTVRAWTYNYHDFELQINGVKALMWVPPFLSTGFGSQDSFLGSWSGVFDLALNDLIDIWATATHGDALGNVCFYGTATGYGMKFAGYKLIE